MNIIAGKTESREELTFNLSFSPRLFAFPAKKLF